MEFFLKKKPIYQVYALFAESHFAESHFAESMGHFADFSAKWASKFGKVG